MVAKELVSWEKADKHKSIISIILYSLHSVSQISVPSGNKVSGTISPRMMNIQVFVTSDAYQTLEGICGTFDDYRDDDLKVRGSGKICKINNDWFDVSPTRFP